MMQGISNREKALRLLETVGAGEPDYELLSPNAMWWILGRGDYPAHQFLEYSSTNQFLPGGKNEIVGVTAEHDRVAIEVRSFMQTTDGRDYSNQYHFVVEFRDGIVVRVKEYLDTAYANRFYGMDLSTQP